MVSMPANICTECYQKFTAAIESNAVDSGSVNIYCEHNAVLLSGELMHGLLIDWLLLPCPNQARGYQLVEEIRRELVEKISHATEKQIV
jgi:hypothetical protein